MLLVEGQNITKKLYPVNADRFKIAFKGFITEADKLFHGKGTATLRAAKTDGASGSLYMQQALAFGAEKTSLENTAGGGHGEPQQSRCMFEPSESVRPLGVYAIPK